jgi:hypothetical protein
MTNLMKYVGNLEMWRWRRMKFSWTDNVREEKVLRGVWVERNMCFWRVRPPPGVQGPLIHVVSRSHTTTHHSR